MSQFRLEELLCGLEKNEMKRSLWKICGFFLLFALLVTWAVTALDYGDSVAVGTYWFERNGESSSLQLKPNHTFRQTWRLGSKEQHSEGTWRRVGEGGISFSKEFLPVTGDEPEPDGESFADMQKALGLFPSLKMRQYHVLWYGKTDSSASVVGTYQGDEPNVTAALILNADHSFAQTITRDGIENHATGTWSQDSNGTVRFSQAFLKTSGEPLTANESASSMDPQASNLQVEISLSEHVPEPVFTKRLHL
jgi:hypothetical protein